jgi:hypothetical protein
MGFPKTPGLRRGNFQWFYAGRDLTGAYGENERNHARYIPAKPDQPWTFSTSGVPHPTLSLGELLRQAKGNVEAWGLSLTTFAVFVLMVVLINFIGEALLQAFDPRRR